MDLNSNVWLPHVKFTLQTIAISFPENPNDVTKKKYYHLVQNLPVFIPHKPFGANFKKLLDDFPVTPYLESRMSFMKWVHFIFNKINVQQNKPAEEFYDSLEKYYNAYKPRDVVNYQMILTKKKYIQLGIVSCILISSIYFYNK